MEKYYEVGKKLEELRVGDILKKEDKTLHIITEKLCESSEKLFYHFYGFAIEEKLMIKMFENRHGDFIVYYPYKEVSK